MLMPAIFQSCYLLEKFLGHGYHEYFMNNSNFIRFSYLCLQIST